MIERIFRSASALGAAALAGGRLLSAAQLPETSAELGVAPFRGTEHPVLTAPPQAASSTSELTLPPRPVSRSIAAITPSRQDPVRESSSILSSIGGLTIGEEATPAKEAPALKLSPSIERYLAPLEGLSFNHSRYGGNALRREMMRSRRLQLADELGVDRERLLRRQDGFDTRVGIGVAEAFVAALDRSEEVQKIPGVSQLVALVDGGFEGLAAAERHLEIRKGVVIDFFGEVRRDFSDFLRARRVQDGGRVADSSFNYSEIFPGSAWSDLPSEGSRTHKRLRLGPEGLGLNHKRYGLYARAEASFGSESFLPPIMQEGRWYITARYRPLASDRNEGSSDARKNSRFMLLVGYEKRF